MADTLRAAAHELLDRNRWYSGFTVALILLNVATFVLSTESSFLTPEWNGFFNVVEVVTTVVFTIDYVLRLWCVPELEGYGEGIANKLSYSVSFYALIDLASILPFYVDIFITQDLPASQFVRILRLFRMMRLEGRYTQAFTLFDDIVVENAELLTGGVHRGLLALCPVDQFEVSGVSLSSNSQFRYRAPFPTQGSFFVGVATWLIVASLYYLAEKNNDDMIWVHSQCRGPDWNASTSEKNATLPLCSNRFGSITSSSYFALLNLFGEFPLIDNHSTIGRFIGSFCAIVATVRTFRLQAVSKGATRKANLLYSTLPPPLPPPPPR